MLVVKAIALKTKATPGAGECARDIQTQTETERGIISVIICILLYVSRYTVMGCGLDIL